jgi:nicotinamidase-related amidase
MKQGYGLLIPEALADLCDPARTAIIIYDMQRGIVPQVSTGPQLVDGCRALLTRARPAGFRIFYTRHISLPNRAAGVAQLRRAMIWQRVDEAVGTQPAFLPDSASAQIVAELCPQQGDVIIDKITMSAFEGTYLNIALRDLGISAIAIAGIALEVGIEPTIRHALDLNYVPILFLDLCGSRSDDLRERSISTLQQTSEVLMASSADWLSLFP